MVLVREDNLKRLQWPLAVVTELHTGPDGIVRSVKIRAAKGVFQRAGHRLHMLGLCSECDEHCQPAGGSSEPINLDSLDVSVNNQDSVDALMDSSDSVDASATSKDLLDLPNNGQSSAAHDKKSDPLFVPTVTRTVRVPVKLDL